MVSKKLKDAIASFLTAASFFVGSTKIVQDDIRLAFPEPKMKVEELSSDIDRLCNQLESSIKSIKKVEFKGKDCMTILNELLLYFALPFSVKFPMKISLSDNRLFYLFS